jgi:hypothetical protein
VTIHNQLSHSAELQNGIAIAVGLPSTQDGVIRLGETLDPTIDVWSQPEWAYLRGERLGAGRGFAAAVAAEFSIVALGNAAGSGNIVVVDKVSAEPSGNLVLSLEVVADSIIAATLSAAAFFGSGRDRRFGSTAGRTFLRSGTDPGSTFGVQLEHQVGATTLFANFTCPPIVLKPGDDLIVIGQSVNLSLDVNFSWRERKAWSGELPA